MGRIARTALADNEGIKQRYSEEFVLEMAPMLKEFILPVREVITSTIFYSEVYLGVSYQVPTQPGSWHKRARIYERQVQGEDVTIIELSSSTERMTLLWCFDYDDAMNQAADYLQAALLSEGNVYVPKKIPIAWYANEANEHNQ